MLIINLVINKNVSIRSLFAGLVFLQYRNETKRALLPNEITSIDTVKALFVRSFPKQLTMQYMDGNNIKIYIHDTTKSMFYELEDDRLVCTTFTKHTVLFSNFSCVNLFDLFN